MARKGHPAPHVKERPINHYKGFPNILLLKMVAVVAPKSSQPKDLTLAKALANVRAGYAPRTIAGYTPGLATLPQANLVKLAMKSQNTTKEQARRMKQMGRGAS